MWFKLYSFLPTMMLPLAFLARVRLTSFSVPTVDQSWD